MNLPEPLLEAAPAEAVESDPPRVLITGGAGFIGSSLAAFRLRQGARVTLLDNFSRPGGRMHWSWLESLAGPGQLRLMEADLRHPRELAAAVRGQDEIYHFAAQVAVTTSLLRPRRDFQVNAAGTLHLLEAMRRHAPGAFFLFTSTNKVYGALAGRAAAPVSESTPLDPQTPYGCSKAAADQYVRDYARIYGLRTVVFRMSCIYGPRQFGSEDQGWVAHLARQALSGLPVCVFGDGSQVRDLLHVRDLIAAFEAVRRQPRAWGQVFNIGGGPQNQASVMQVLAAIEAVTGQAIALHHGPWRTGDQRYYVSGLDHMAEITGWQPRTGWQAGLRELLQWAQTLVPAAAAPPLKPVIRPREQAA